jgi:hypothetical protein
MAKAKTKKKAVKKVEKAVRRAVKKGVTEKTVELAVEHAIVTATASDQGSKKNAKPPIGNPKLLNGKIKALLSTESFNGANWYNRTSCPASLRKAGEKACYVPCDAPVFYRRHETRRFLLTQGQLPDAQQSR